MNLLPDTLPAPLTVIVREMPAFGPPPPPRVFDSPFAFPGQPFVCTLDGVPFTAAMLRNRAALDWPLPADARALLAGSVAA